MTKKSNDIKKNEMNFKEKINFLQHKRMLVLWFDFRS